MRGFPKNLKSVILSGGVISLILVAVWFGFYRKIKFQAWINKMDRYRNEVLVALEHTPYRSDQRDSFRDYFGELRSKTEENLASQDDLRRFNEAISKREMEEVCARVLIPRKKWETIAHNCTKSGFFLCSEGTKHYSELVNAMRGSLLPKQRLRFDQSSSCVAALF